MPENAFAVTMSPLVDAGDCNCSLPGFQFRLPSTPLNTTLRLEVRLYGELAAMEEITYSKPELEDVGVPSSENPVLVIDRTAVVGPD